MELRRNILVFFADMKNYIRLYMYLVIATLLDMART